MKKLIALISALTMCAVMIVPVISLASENSNSESETAISEDVDEDEDNNTKDIDINTENQTSTVKCTKVVTSSYMVTIPDGNADLSKPATLIVSADNVVIKKNQKLNITISSENKWNLCDKDAGNLAYKLTAMKEVETDEETDEPILEKENIDEETDEPILEKENIDEETDEPKIEKGDILVCKETAEDIGNEFTVLTVLANQKSGKTIMQAEVEDTATIAGEYTDTLTFTVSLDSLEEETPEDTANSVEEVDNS